MSKCVSHLTPYFLAGKVVSLQALSGASAKFRPLLEAGQSRTSCEADVADVDPTQRDVYARSSRPSASRTASSISLQVSKRRPLSASDLRVFHQGSITFKYAA